MIDVLRLPDRKFFTSPCPPSQGEVRRKSSSSGACQPFSSAEGRLKQPKAEAFCGYRSFYADDIEGFREVWDSGSKMEIWTNMHSVILIYKGK